MFVSFGGRYDVKIFDVDGAILHFYMPAIFQAFPDCDGTLREICSDSPNRATKTHRITGIARRVAIHDLVS